MKKVFNYEESPYNKGKYIITINHETLPIKSISGSYNVIPARMMCLSYAQYLRMCRDLFGATIIGKNSLYPVAYFNRDEGLMALLKLLNKRAEYFLYRKEHPYEIEQTKTGVRKIFDDGHVEEV